MSRNQRVTSEEMNRFPRVSGDEPVSSAFEATGGGFSPRERG